VTLHGGEIRQQESVQSALPAVDWVCRDTAEHVSR
jgi:hypothetical protein